MQWKQWHRESFLECEKSFFLCVDILEFNPGGGGDTHSCKVVAARSRENEIELEIGKWLECRTGLFNSPLHYLHPKERRMHLYPK